MDTVLIKHNPSSPASGVHLDSPSLSAAAIPGSLPLRNPNQERFARARSLLLPRLDAYCQAFDKDRSAPSPKQLHAARGNAARLERAKAMQDRIARLTRQDEEVLAEKRKRLEEFLWLIHEANPADLWEVAEKIKTDEDGEPVLDEKGRPVKIRYQRARFLADLPEDVQRIVEGVTITDSGKVVTKTYSKMQANQELRKLLGIGVVSGVVGDDISDISTAQIVAELHALGVDVKFAMQVTSR
jgi:hypothetical protein